MSDILVAHAKTHVWQEPTQDYQYNVGLGRITKDGGFLGEAQYMWHKFLSPTRDTFKRRYHHLYQIGQISPITLNLVDQLVEDEWYPAEDLVVKHNVMIQVYMETGAIVPLNHIYIMKDYTNNLTLCIWHDRNMDYGTFSDDAHVLSVKQSTNSRITLDNDKLLVRFYSNARQHELQFNAASGRPGDSILTLSGVVDGQRNFNLLQNKLTVTRREFNQKGMVLTYIDGFLSNRTLVFSNDLIGKTISYIVDESFKAVHAFELEHLPVFVSKVDRNRKKYLLLYDNVYDEIDYWDDTDFYLFNKTLNRGVFISRAREYAFRQISHNAVSVDAETIRYYLRVHGWLSDIGQCQILAYVRQGGMVKEILPQRNRIDEVFRLPYESILNVMVDTDSGQPEWNARELEASAYMSLLGASNELITKELVSKSYGYSAIVSSIANPVRTVDVDGNVEVPEVLRLLDRSTKLANRTFWCYDATGKYIGYFNSTTNDHVVGIRDNFPTATTVECFRARSRTVSENNGLYYNQDYTGWELEDYGFRCYICPIENGQPTEVWDDVTGKPYYTLIPSKDKQPPKLVWNWSNLTNIHHACLLKLNHSVLVNTFAYTQAQYNGYWSFILSALHQWGNTAQVRPLSVPYGTVEIFANGSCLVEGIDYYMHYPKVVITNARINALSSVTFVVRLMGAGNSQTCKPYKPVEIGFVREGYLSVDAQYDIGKHRPNKTVVNNLLVPKGKYRSSEYRPDGVLYKPDGRPYMFMDYWVNVDLISGKSTTDLYEEMLSTDRRLGDYLTRHIPDPPILLPRVQTERWMLISPVMCALLHTIKNGGLTAVNGFSNLSVADVHTLMQPYTWLLDYDPAFLESDYDYTYVLPHPFDRAMSVSLKQYQFLENVNLLYLHGRLDLSNLVTIG